MMEVRSFVREESGSARRIVWEGLTAGWPICLGYAPIGLAFGVLAQKAGLTPVEIGLMSLIVFAGSAQFIAVSMMSAGASIATIVATTFMVNLRHLLMSSSLAEPLRGSSPKFLTLFAYGLTDESFAVNIIRFREGAWSRYSALTVNHAANLAWFVCTVAGGYGGQFIPAGALGMDYALIAMFLCLLAFQLRGRLYALTGLVAAVAAVLLSLVTPGNSYVIVASLIAATTGFAAKRLQGRKSAA